ncbi:hypothetical protein GCM10010317_001150 [Streptomyces mirabilis]|nr:hypothetical protein GCM10010317_001150 [Streptomyces mirabilis]
MQKPWLTRHPVPAPTARPAVHAGIGYLPQRHSINTVNSFRLTLRQGEHDRLMSAAARLNYADSVTGIDPRLLVPAPAPDDV